MERGQIRCGWCGTDQADIKGHLIISPVRAHDGGRNMPEMERTQPNQALCLPCVRSALGTLVEISGDDGLAEFRYCHFCTTPWSQAKLHFTALLSVCEECLSQAKAAMEGAEENQQP